ncbi:MAG: Fic family protein [Deltaproteobacteria bacterium]|nr:Fic family protein [Deltaproteobacteria bacterium]
MALSFNASDELTLRLKQTDLVAAKHSSLLESLQPRDLEAMSRQVRISTIGATTRIENAILTDAQIDWIDTVLTRDGRPSSFAALRSQIEDKLSKRHERSLEEVAGCREMLTTIYSQGRDLFPLTLATLRGLHQQLLQYHAPAAYHLGRFKVVPNSVIQRNALTGTEREVLKTSDPGPLTDAAMSDLLDWYNETLPHNPWPLAVASELVFRFLACHPFQDGNGRMGRVLFILALLQSPEPHWNQLAPYLAVDRVIEQRRVEYYSVLAQTSGGRFDPDPHNYNLPLFIRFMSRVVDEALEAVNFYKDRAAAIFDLAPAPTTVLEYFRDLPEQRLTAALLRQATGLPGRTITRALSTLLNAKLIQRYGRGPATRYQLAF